MRIKKKATLFNICCLLANFATVIFAQEDASEARKIQTEISVRDESLDFIAKLPEDEALAELNDAIRMGNIKRTEKILEVFPFLLNRKDKFGGTPLFNACHAEKLEIVKLLLEKKADISLSNTYGDLPVHRAAQTGNVEILDLLFAHGAVFWSKNRKGETPIFKAVSEGREGAVQLLLDKGEIVNNVDSQGNTPLHKAAIKGNVKMVSFLLSKGAKANAKNNAGKKPAELATDVKVRKLLEIKDTDIPEATRGGGEQ